MEIDASVKKKSNNIFKRYEKKYILTKDKQDQFLKLVQTYLQVDQYGESTICNLYYDTASYELIRTSIEKPVYKEKLRLRSYGIPGNKDNSFVELKKKYDGIVYKRRIELPLDEAKRYLDKGIPPVNDTQIKREIDYFLQFYQPIKKMFIAYDRIAMFGILDESIRVTFDCNIRYRLTDLDLERGDYGTCILEPGQILMEIKVLGAYPLWMVEALSKLHIYPTSFSKYGSCYEKEINKVKQVYQEKTKEHQEVAICLPA